MINNAKEVGLDLPLTIENCRNYLKKQGYHDLADELDEAGIGSEFVQLEKQGIPIDEQEFF